MEPKICYSREFLLSISGLDTCKKLPSGFDESLISIWAFTLLPDRPRNPGNLPLQGFRRNEHASSPPNRGDTTAYSRGIYGKWESRSSARSDRDGDSQSDKDSDSGSRFGHQPRRPWQTPPEHDGLLGSGSFPRPTGYATGPSAAMVRTNEHSQLSRSSEPYHPPRPYKSAPHSRRDTDAYNDETFGSTECDSEDRAQQERRRRASFEMMRKEQHKTLQEKQNSNTGNNKAGDASDLFEVLGNSKEEKRNHELPVSAATPMSSNDPEKSSLASQAHASRMLVPPGFKSNPLEKSSGLKSLIHPSLSEVGKTASSQSTEDGERNPIRNANDVSCDSGQLTERIHSSLLLNKGENMNVHLSLDGPKKTVIEDQLVHISSHLETHSTLDDPNSTELNANALGYKNVCDSSRSHSTSILEKIFGSSLSTNDGSSSLMELQTSKPEDTRSPKSVHSSKFAQWFSEEEAKAVDDVSSSVQNNLLSLIVGIDKGKLDMPPATNGISNQACPSNKEDTAPTVLTCEDLEQSILSEYSAKTTYMQPDLKSWNATGGGFAQTSGHADNHASLHLLSILQKNSDQANAAANSFNINLANAVPREHDRATAVDELQGEENGNLGKTLTLEALFGTAFMNELQSVEAPVSVHRSSTGSSRVDALEPREFSFPIGDSDIYSSTVERNGLQGPSHHYSVPSNHRQHAQLGGAENWLNLGNSSIGISSSKRAAEALNKNGGVETNVGYQLPEQENLICACDTPDPRVFPLMPGGNSINEVNSSNTPINVADKLAAFGAVTKDKYGMDGSESIPFPRDLSEQRGPGISYSNLQLPHQSSPHFQPPQISQARPLQHHLESHPAHMSSHLKFMGPEPTFNHDSPTNHQFSSPIIRPSFHNLNVGVSGFDVPSQNSVPQHHMQVPGNHPNHFARSGPGAHHGNQAPGFVPEMNQMQGLPNTGSGNPPEAFQRLIEMDLRSNSKQIRPLAPAELVDMESRHRW